MHIPYQSGNRNTLRGHIARELRDLIEKARRKFRTSTEEVFDEVHEAMADILTYNNLRELSDPGNVSVILDPSLVK